MIVCASKFVKMKTRPIFKAGLKLLLLYIFNNISLFFVLFDWKQIFSTQRGIVIDWNRSKVRNVCTYVIFFSFLPLFLGYRRASLNLYNVVEYFNEADRIGLSRGNHYFSDFLTEEESHMLCRWGIYIVCV